MFDKKKKPYTDLLGKTNRIVEGTIIKGDIISKADFRLDGELIGNFQTSGKLVIGPAGIVTGDIICNNVDIEGKFSGIVQVRELLNVKATANVKGEVKVGKLSVDPGADFSATCVMNATEKQTVAVDEQKQ
jgi:cytoskeletal protein CcmA (bactofilin family)